MAKRCPPGVICIENVTIIIILLIIVCIILYINLKNQTDQVIIKENPFAGLFPKPSYSFSNVPNDVLLNPYQAPLKDERLYPINTVGDPRGIPINIPTQSVDTTYRQVGILTRLNSNGDIILPLMGRPLFTNRDKWNYYTMTDKNNMIKLPITYKGKSCTNEYGADRIYNGDTVYVEGYNDAFKTTIYDNDVMRYIPYL
tara:strand:+ start:1756 stop:2352 length:597 start_codon:yes stop_codon:yes gene_type:complete